MTPPQEPHGRAVSGSERLYRALLAAYPKEFRQAHGREMAQVFRCMCREEVVSSGSRGLARLWVRTLLDLLATALAERAKQALGWSTLVGSSPKLFRWGGLAAAAGGVLLIASGVLSWVNEALLYGEVTAIGGDKLGPQWALGLIQAVGYLLFLGGLAGLFGLLERARRTRPRQAGSVRSLSLTLAYCSAVAGIVLIGLAAAATVASVVQLSTVGVVTIGGGIPRGSFLHMALDVSAWLMLSGLPLGIVLLGVAVLRWGLLRRWSVLPLAIGLLMKPLLGYFTFYLLALVTGADISDGDIMLVPTPWPDWSGFYTYVVDNAIIGTSWVLLGWVLWSSRAERLGSGVERASL
ncbi:MAG: hypothetical protein M3426_08905 [Actinomycetota bacterium]|nr:hypothetical protein [Actinomycetota bacterium]